MISEGSFSVKFFASITSSGTSSFPTRQLSSFPLICAPQQVSLATHLQSLKRWQHQYCHGHLFLVKFHFYDLNFISDVSTFHFFAALSVLLSQFHFNSPFCIISWGFMTGGKKATRLPAWLFVRELRDGGADALINRVWKKHSPLSQMPNTPDDQFVQSQLIEGSICKMIDLPNDQLVEFAKIPHWPKSSFKGSSSWIYSRKWLFYS